LAFLDRLFASKGGDEAEPKELGGCRLIEKLAVGPMSTVYLAESPGGEHVVVMVLSRHGNRIADKLSVKLKKPWEGERARPLNHPNVVKTFSYGKERGTYFIVMEYLPGGSLAEHLRVRTPSVMGRRLEILLEAAKALAYVHEKGIIHRDMCPKNLMFDSQGAVKLIDFGVAIHKSDRLKQTEVRTGRPSYLAPELIRHNHFNVQTDVYAFGVTTYETFTGRRPFTANSRDELMSLHLRAEPVPPSRVDPSINRAVDAVVLGTLNKVPQQRYQTMQQVISALVGLRGQVI